MHDNSWLMPLVFVGIASIRLIALGSKARVKNNCMEFSGTILHRLVILLGSSGTTAVLLMTWSTSEVWIRVGLSIGVVGIALGWPPIIQINNHDITQKWWWRRRVSIPWSEVSSIEENGVGEYNIYGRDGETVHFSRYLVDSPRFIRQVRMRAQAKISRADAPIRITER